MMEHVRFRTVACVAAFADGLISIYNTVYLWKFVMQEPDMKDLDPRSKSQLYLINEIALSEIAVVVSIVFTFIQLVTAGYLYNTTRLGHHGNLKEALNETERWQHVSVLSLTIPVSTHLLTKGWVQHGIGGVIIGGIIRFGLIGVATLFIHELKKWVPADTEENLVQ